MCAPPPRFQYQVTLPVKLPNVSGLPETPHVDTTSLHTPRFLVGQTINENDPISVLKGPIP